MTSGRGMQKCEPMSRPILPPRAPMPMVPQRLSSKPDPMAGNMRLAEKYPSTRPRSGRPEAPARKAQTVKRAALAPRDPSMQDRQVANQAAQLEAQARQEVKAEKAKENKEATESGNAPSSIEKSGESNTNSESDNDSGQDTPFARRLANRFNPSSITSGNLIDIIS